MPSVRVPKAQGGQGEAVWGAEQNLEVHAGVSTCMSMKPLRCGMEPGWEEKGGWTWVGGQGLALHVLPLLAEKSKESENSKFEPSLPGHCQGRRMDHILPVCWLDL